MARLLVVSRSMALALRLADSHEVVEHPAEALDTLDPDPQIDVIVLDVGEPATAVSVLDSLRRRGSLVPVLIVSGYQPAWAGLAALDLPGVVVVPLPITRTALLSGIERLESGRRARSAVPQAPQPPRPAPLSPTADLAPPTDAPVTGIPAPGHPGIAPPPPSPYDLPPAPAAVPVLVKTEPSVELDAPTVVRSGEPALVVDLSAVPEPAGRVDGADGTATVDVTDGAQRADATGASGDAEADDAQQPPVEAAADDDAAAEAPSDESGVDADATSEGASAQAPVADPDAPGAVAIADDATDAGDGDDDRSSGDEPVDAGVEPASGDAEAEADEVTLITPDPGRDDEVDAAADAQGEPVDADAGADAPDAPADDSADGPAADSDGDRADDEQAAARAARSEEDEPTVAGQFNWWRFDDSQRAPADLFVPARPISPHEALTVALDLGALADAYRARENDGEDVPVVAEVEGAPRPETSDATSDATSDEITDETDGSTADASGDASGETSSDDADVADVERTEVTAAVPSDVPADSEAPAADAAGPTDGVGADADDEDDLPTLAPPAGIAPRPAVVDLPPAFAAPGEVEWAPQNGTAPVAENPFVDVHVPQPTERVVDLSAPPAGPPHVPAGRDDQPHATAGSEPLQVDAPEVDEIADDARPEQAAATTSGPVTDGTPEHAPSATDDAADEAADDAADGAAAEDVTDEPVAAPVAAPASVDGDVTVVIGDAELEALAGRRGAAEPSGPRSPDADVAPAAEQQRPSFAPPVAAPQPFRPPVQEPPAAPAAQADRPGAAVPDDDPFPSFDAVLRAATAPDTGGGRRGFGARHVAREDGSTGEQPAQPDTPPRPAPMPLPPSDRMAPQLGTPTEVDAAVMPTAYADPPAMWSEPPLPTTFTGRSGLHARDDDDTYMDMTPARGLTAPVYHRLDELEPQDYPVEPQAPVEQAGYPSFPPPVPEAAPAAGPVPFVPRVAPDAGVPAAPGDVDPGVDRGVDRVFDESFEDDEPETTPTDGHPVLDAPPAVTSGWTRDEAADDTEDDDWSAEDPQSLLARRRAILGRATAPVQQPSALQRRLGDRPVSTGLGIGGSSAELVALSAPATPPAPVEDRVGDDGSDGSDDRPAPPWGTPPPLPPVPPADDRTTDAPVGAGAPDAGSAEGPEDGSDDASDGGAPEDGHESQGSDPALTPPPLPPTAFTPPVAPPSPWAAHGGFTPPVAPPPWAPPAPDLRSAPPPVPGAPVPLPPPAFAPAATLTPPPLPVLDGPDAVPLRLEAPDGGPLRPLEPPAGLPGTGVVAIAPDLASDDDRLTPPPTPAAANGAGTLPGPHDVTVPLDDVPPFGVGADDRADVDGTTTHTGTDVDADVRETAAEADDDAARDTSAEVSSPEETPDQEAQEAASAAARSAWDAALIRVPTPPQPPAAELDPAPFTAPAFVPPPFVPPPASRDHDRDVDRDVDRDDGDGSRGDDRYAGPSTADPYAADAYAAEPYGADAYRTDQRSGGYDPLADPLPDERYDERYEQPAAREDSVLDRRSAPSVRELVRSLAERSSELFGVSETCQVLAEDVVDRAVADAAAVVVPDGSVWRVSGGVGLRPLERRLLLDARHWLVAEVAMGGQAVVVGPEAPFRAQLAGAPLAAWEHLLAIPVPEVNAAVVVARSRTGPPFTEADLAAVVSSVQEAAGLLQAAMATRRLARLIGPLAEDDEV